MSDSLRKVLTEKQLLPKGWDKLKLSAAVEPRGDRVSPADFPGLPFIGMDHVEAHTTKIIGSVPARDMKSNAARFYAGDILYGRLRPYLNKVAQPKVDGLASAEFIVFPENELIKSSFLKYRLNARDFVGFANHLNEGDRPRVSFEQIGDFDLLVPPIAEQTRIVAKLEELFSELDKGVENLRTAQQQLKVYRQALLDKAMSSFKSADCDLIPLQRLIGNINQGWSPKCDLNREAMDDEWAIIKTTVVQSMCYMPQECKPLPAHFEPRLDLEIRDGDFLMTRKGPRNRTGVVCLVKKARPKSMLCDTVYRFRCNAELVAPEYLELMLNSPSVVAELDRRKSGISDSGISLNHAKINTISLQIPRNIDSQRKVVDLLAGKLSIVDQLENTITTALQQAEALRQSILKKAFSGKLVPQHPEDEPASVLLERIRAERDAQQPAPRRGRQPKAAA